MPCGRGAAWPEQVPQPPSLTERGAPLLQAVPQVAPRERVTEIEASRAAQTESLNSDGNATVEQAPAAFPKVDAPQQFRVVPIRGQVELRPLPKQSGPVEQFVPKDAFDPEIFNRRFFGE